MCLHHELTHFFTYLALLGRTQGVQQEVSSPQAFLDRMISACGYCTKMFSSLEGGYYCKPTPLQKASYGIRTVQAVRSSDAALLTKLLQCGLSPNPCNAFGESIVHMACRRGDFEILQVLVNAGCSLHLFRLSLDLAVAPRDVLPNFEIKPF